MPQLSNVVLKDRNATDVTFKPRDANGGVALLVATTGVPIGDKRLTMSHTRTSNGREKTVIKLAVPVVQDVVVNGVSKPTVVRVAYADMTFTADGTSNTDERADILAMAADLLTETSTVAMVRDLETVYG